MKILSLNLWGGKLFRPLMKFIEVQAGQYDIFCFQEMMFGDAPTENVNGTRTNLYAEIEARLPDYIGYQLTLPQGTTFGFVPEIPKDNALLGMAIFIHRSISAFHGEAVKLYDDKNLPENQWRPGASGRLQMVELEKNGQKFILGNIHGLWTPTGKDDSPDRDLQMNRVIDAFGTYEKASQIIIGDFNLRPQGSGLKLLVKNGLRNLVDEYGIKNTRNSQYKNMETYKDYISDYAFISNNLKVKDFRVLPDEVSDHAPLALECE